LTPAPNCRLIKDGTVYESETKRLIRRDLLIENGVVADIGESVRKPAGAEETDARGKLVMPGLIDFHLHCFSRGQLLGVDADEIAPRAGTTAFVDAGSCGSINFSAFRAYVIEPATAKIFAFLNISALGQHALGIRGIDAHEYEDERFLHLDSALETIEGNRDRLIGVKVRMCAENYSKAPLETALKTAAAAKLPLMVHIGDDTVPLAEVLAALRAGDIVTHTYHGGKDSILDAKGLVRRDVADARARGVLFDVGLDRVHSSFAVIRPALEQGFYPDFISTDLAVVNRHVTVDMPTTISKFLALGLPLEEAIHRSTATAAMTIGKTSVAGALRVGTPADIGIFELEEGDFEYKDTYGNSVKAQRRLAPRETFIDGRKPPEKAPIPAPGFIAP